MFLRFALTLAAAVLLALVSGCSREPRINSFTATPQNACRGDEITLRWDTVGDAVDLTSAHGGTSGVGGASSFATVIDGDTLFRLSARIGDRLVSETRLVSVRSPLEFAELLTPRCAGPTPQFPSFGYQESQFSRRFKVTSVTNLSAQPVTVQHLAINRELGPGAATTEAEFGTVELVGDWQITARLPANACAQQTTGGGTPPPPLPSFRVQVVATCR